MAINVNEPDPQTITDVMNAIAASNLIPNFDINGSRDFVRTLAIICNACIDAKTWPITKI